MLFFAQDTTREGLWRGPQGRDAARVSAPHCSEAAPSFHGCMCFWLPWLVTHPRQAFLSIAHSPARRFQLYSNEGFPVDSNNVYYVRQIKCSWHLYVRLRVPLHRTYVFLHFVPPSPLRPGILMQGRRNHENSRAVLITGTPCSSLRRRLKYRKPHLVRHDLVLLAQNHQHRARQPREQRAALALRALHRRHGVPPVEREPAEVVVRQPALRVQRAHHRGDRRERVLEHEPAHGRVPRPVAQPRGEAHGGAPAERVPVEHDGRRREARVRVVERVPVVGEEPVLGRAPWRGLPVGARRDGEDRGVGEGVGRR